MSEEAEVKNPRKLRLWEADLVNSTYVVTEQFKEQIASLIDNLEQGYTIKDLPPSMVPTETLFHMVVCYAYMYEALLDEHLIATGNKKQTKTIH